MKGDLKYGKLYDMNKEELIEYVKDLQMIIRKQDKLLIKEGYAVL